MPLKNDRTSELKIDPVMPDQGGRLTASDPASELSPPTRHATEEAVRRKAYELYEKKGRREGQALNDWVEAEAQFR